MMGFHFCSTLGRPAFRTGLLAVAAAGALFCFAPTQSSRAQGAAEACVPTAAAVEEAAAPGDAATIRVTVENVRSSDGLITAILYPDNPKNFLKEGKRLDKVRVEAQEGETVLCLNAPSAGRYSIALYHDENGNRDFDRNFLGIPTEGYGFSENPGFRFGKPEQEETLFTIEESLTVLRISVLYL